MHLYLFPTNIPITLRTTTNWFLYFFFVVSLNQLWALMTATMYFYSNDNGTFSAKLFFMYCITLQWVLIFQVHTKWTLFNSQLVSKLFLILQAEHSTTFRCSSFKPKIFNKKVAWFLIKKKCKISYFFRISPSGMVFYTYSYYRVIIDIYFHLLNIYLHHCEYQPPEIKTTNEFFGFCLNFSWRKRNWRLHFRICQRCDRNAIFANFLFKNILNVYLPLISYDSIFYSPQFSFAYPMKCDMKTLMAWKHKFTN